jgi:hypothetical protein
MVGIKLQQFSFKMVFSTNPQQQKAADSAAFSKAATCTPYIAHRAPSFPWQTLLEKYPETPSCLSPWRAFVSSLVIFRRGYW